jgi:hypothetical protein
VRARRTSTRSRGGEQATGAQDAACLSERRQSRIALGQVVQGPQEEFRVHARVGVRQSDGVSDVRSQPHALLARVRERLLDMQLDGI